ncbi:hypothetical protein [Hufsiella ginkgonis]|uniref:DUF1349 domain-containing protein n=1 Tax=Hufsiella ginkgonis TaxID=2695274 RepID=A0A7K1XV01_9SPHI|nr:hypothetical protein [Hufsiella ginkgonis]MXV14812.1 hypothetical protein [Hufsiella ginkgonis]
MKKIDFTDYFTDNRNSWPQESKPGIETGIKDNAYHIYHNRSDSSYAMYLGFHYIIREKAFSLQLRMKTSGDPDIAAAQSGILFGLIIDDQKRWTYDLFSISSSGFFVGTHIGEDDRWEPEVNWLEHPAINVGAGQSNLLRIEKFDREIDQSCYYFINNELVHQSKSLPLRGFLQGIWVSGQIDVSFDLFNVSYLSI